MEVYATKFSKGSPAIEASLPPFQFILQIGYLASLF